MPALRAIALILCFCWLDLRAADSPSPEEKVIVYIDEDSAGSHAFLAKVRSAFLRSRAGAQYRINLQLAATEVSDKAALEATLRRVLKEPPTLIIASNSNAAAVAKSLTHDVPILFGSHQDPIAMGLVDSLAHPGGNLTGFTYFVPIDSKRLELLRTLAPRAKALGIVIDRWWLAESGGSVAVAIAGERLGFEVALFSAETEGELAAAMRTSKARAIEAWYVPYTRLAYEHPQAALSAVQAMRRPAVFPTTRFVEDGGLVSYQQLLPLEEIVEVFAKMIGLVLDGVPVAQIPVERPKEFELAVNVSTARSLGLVIPDAMLKRAERVFPASTLVVPAVTS